ncbi:hypothetical protein AURDEDRAFT_180465 [Auricularia subglabra TFB-10046 SS5]|nr:hypothetical protein AURDEDRAFT_180465 [Auricularia subglabra TFB-10046 SS5]
MSFGFWSRSLGRCLRPLSHQTQAPHLSSFFSTRPRYRPAVKPAARAEAAQASRLVWQAVRQELANGNPAGAIDVANAAAIADPSVRAPKGIPTSVEFRGLVSSKLASHSLVHGLLRSGMPFAAAEQLQSRMTEGIKIRQPTLRAVIDALVLAQAGPSEAEVGLLGTSTQFARNSQRLEAQHPKLLPGTRTAIQILRCARRTRNDRTHQMYEKLIDACLLQGEIVIGCLLFALIARDWQVRRTLAPKTPLGGPPHGDPAIDGQPLTADQVVAARKLGLHHWGTRIPKPQPEMMQSLLGHIVFPGAATSAKFKPARNPGPLDDEQVRSMKRAVFALAELLEHRALDMDVLASLIHVMSNVPRQPVVRIPRQKHGGGIVSLVDVNEYCHSTILNFSKTLPQRYVQPSKATPSMVRPISTRTYNTLLDYLLRHRMDIGAAREVLRHMCARRDIHPTIVTYNIIVRRASLLRRNDIVHEALELFRKRDDITDPMLRKIVESLPPADSPAPRNPWKAKSSAAPADLARGPAATPSETTPAETPASHAPLPPNPYSEREFNHALENLAVAQFSLLGMDPAVLKDLDAYTLSAYITHLTSRGEPENVVKLLYALFPELQRQPASLQSDSVRQRLLAARKRGAKMGPYFFSTVLNALRKAGKTGLAERVWYLAQMSEEASWAADAAVSERVQPWCLDITAYTAMLQCYARESKKGAAAAAKDKAFVVGWGYFNWLREGALGPASPGRRRAREGQPRSIAGRELGYMVMVSMRARAALVWRAFESGRAREAPPPPRPDARFFNALLDIFARGPGLEPRRPRTTPGYFRGRYELALRRYTRRLVLPRGRDPVLAAIADEMARHGFAMPLGLRQLTIGRDTVPFGRRAPAPIRPYRFPVDRHQGFRPYSLHTSKDKGLPIAREPKRWRATTDDWGKKFERQRTVDVTH